MKQLALVLDYWKRHKLQAVLLVLGTAAGAAVTLAFPYLLRFIVDGIKNGVTRAALMRYVFILVGFGFLRGVAHVVLPFSRAFVNEKFQWTVRNRVFRWVLDLGHSFSNKFPTGDVMERLDHDLGELSWFVCSGIFRFVSAFFSVAFAIVLMLTMSPLLTAVTVLPMVLGVFVWMKLGPLVYSRWMTWRTKISEINNRIEAAFTGVRLIKGYNIEQRQGAAFRKTLDERVTAAVDTIKVESRIHVFYMAVLQIGVLAVLWIGGVLVVGGSLTLGEFVAFHAYVMMLVGPMFDIGNLFVSGRRAQGGCERVSALEQHPPEIRNPDKPGEPEFGTLELRNGTFAYGEDPVLKNATMKFPPGARIGIAGTVGSGKSTIFRLLFRLADPQQGQVLMNGCDIRELDLDKYRLLFGYAPQEATLFSDTLESNIAFGRDVGKAELDRVIALAQFSEDLKGLPKGMEETLGERGTRLSGGQRERVAIARSLVGPPKILVFDDATSALDAETEKDLVNRLAEGLGGATVIIVSHRLSILSACSYVYVLDQGEVREEGTHQELLAKRGLYWDLYERQLMREEIEVM